MPNNYYDSWVMTYPTHKELRLSQEMKLNARTKATCKAEKDESRSDSNDKLTLLSSIKLIKFSKICMNRIRLNRHNFFTG